jgi:hypothetical protein
MNVNLWGKGILVLEMIRGKSARAGCCRYCNEYLSVLNGKEFIYLFRDCRLSKMGFTVDESRMKVKVAPVFQTSSLPWDLWNSASPTSTSFDL